MDKWFAFGVLFVLASVPVFAGDQGQLLVFLPQGARGILASPSITIEIPDSNPVLVEQGDYRLTLNCEGYRPIEQNIRIVSQRETVIVPSWQPTMESSQQVAAKVESVRSSILRQGDVVRWTAWGALAAGLVGFGTVGALEWVLADRKKNLDSDKALYQSATGASAAALWSTVEADKAQITDLRACEWSALGVGAVFSISSLVAFAMVPDTEPQDLALQRLRETQR